MAKAVAPFEASTSGAVTLDDWISVHGPLWAPAALTLALQMCAHASRLTRREARTVIGSMNAAGVTRPVDGGWSWMPTPAGPAKAATVSDLEIIERIGAFLYLTLAGQPLSDSFATEQALRTKLRMLRPDVPPAVVDVSVEAIAVRQRTRTSLADFARDLRQVLGIERASEYRHSRRKRMFISSAMLVLAIVGGWWTSVRSLADQSGSNGLSDHQTVVTDIITEEAETLALVDEHTVAIQLYQGLAQLWRTRLPPDDPRLAWNIARQAWVRTLAGDRLTTEQLFVDVRDWVARGFGDGHPYTRTVRLALAEALDARGAAAEAAALRDQAARATRQLLGETTDVQSGVPEPPGVIAHVASIRPELEGFRPRAGGGFFAPMTSAERWLAGRDGWRLHLVARGRCDVTLVAGTIPRLVRAAANRAADGRWQLTVKGTTPPLTLQGSSDDKAVVLLAANGSGTIDARLGDQPSSRSHIDLSSDLPGPPYALTFDEAPAGQGCAVVWLEIPFPSHAK